MVMYYSGYVQIDYRLLQLLIEVNKEGYCQESATVLASVSMAALEPPS